MDIVLIEKGILTGLVQIKLSWDTDNTQCSYGHTSYCLRRKDPLVLVALPFTEGKFSFLASCQ